MTRLRPPNGWRASAGWPAVARALAGLGEAMRLWVIEYRFRNQGSGAWFANGALVFETRAEAETELARRIAAYRTTEYRIGEYARRDDEADGKTCAADPERHRGSAGGAGGRDRALSGSR